MAPNVHEEGKVFSATYSNVPVYECFVGENHVMRRRADHWINATHILKVAGFDKPNRTRILEREVQKGTHEKVQGGYGKYQGTWIPLEDGRALAEKHGILQTLLIILDFVPGDRTPPPAPKHTIASKAIRAARQAVAPKRIQALNHIPEEYEQHFHDAETPDNVTMMSDAYGDEYADMSQYTNPRKRKRMEDILTPQDEQHQLWAEELLDYFMLLENPSDPSHHPPVPPPGINLDRPIDDKGHTALHWAAAMGDTTVVRDLIARGASIDCLSKNGETPLMRAVIFTNNFDKQTMEKIAGWLIRTVPFTEWFGSTVFHHITATTSSKSKYACARYYLDTILNRMAEVFGPMEIEKILNIQDHAGDTAVTIAARNGARKCVRSLIGRNAAVDIPNDNGETADELIVQLNHRRRDGRHRQLSSSPFQDSGMTGLSHMSNGSYRAARMGYGSGHALVTSSPGQFGNGHRASSEASMFLSQKLMPMLESKSAKMAATLDAELGEKENELTELERVARGRQEEIDGLKRGQMELVVKDQDDQADARLSQQLDTLVHEAEARREAQQKDEIDRLVREESSNSDQPNGHEQASKDDVIRAILDLNTARQGLVKALVQDQSLAGVGEHQGDYKRLISRALGIQEDVLEDMLPEICRELEGQREGGPGVFASGPVRGA